MGSHYGHYDAFEQGADERVLLELAWALGGYAWDNGRIARILRELIIGENVINPHHPEAVSRVLRWAVAGMAFADAMHLALSASATEFASFNDALRKKAIALGNLPTVTSPWHNQCL